MEKLFLLGGAALAASQLVSGNNNEGNNNNKPQVPGGSIGGAIGSVASVPSGGLSGSSIRGGGAGPSVTVEAPTVEQEPAKIPVKRGPASKNKNNYSDGGGSSDDAIEINEGDVNIGTSTTSSTTSSASSTPRIDQGQDDSGDGNPQTDTGIFAADTPGIQSDKSSDITQELNQQQGATRSATNKELGNEPDLGFKDKPKEKDKKSGGSSDGGLIPDNIPVLGGF